MNIVKCSKGHFYDADSYRNCPHCENNIFSEDMNTVHVSADKLYDEKTFALYGDNDGDNTLPADLFAPESAAYPGRDNNYYPEDDEGTIPADLDADMTLPADIGGDIEAMSLSDQVMTALDPGLSPDPGRDYDPNHEAISFENSPAYSEDTLPANPSLYQETKPYPETQPYAEDRPLSEIGPETRPETPSVSGHKPKLTISPSLNRPKPSSWPADNGEKSIDFEAEREAERYAASQEFGPMSDAFHAASLDQSHQSVDEDKDIAEEADEKEEVKEEPVVSADYDISFPEDDEYIPEYDDEAISIEDDPDEIESAGFSSLTSEDLPEIAIEEPSFTDEGVSGSEELPDLQIEEAMVLTDAAASAKEEAVFEEEEADAVEEADILEEEEDVPAGEEVITEEAVVPEEAMVLEEMENMEATVEPEKTILVREEDQISCLRTAGWLVCVEGEEEGRSTVIYDGVNIIRPSAAGLSIIEDQNKYDGNEAALIYDKESGQFHLQTGFSGLMIYVNDSLALMPVQLTDRDRISWGSSEYIFVPFCNDDFRW